ncbi:NADP-dependent oxidoreductase [Aspergillus undulatus]|uniref:NADP-dependent oxidoreductase n=1 Tax=Aspergillus undulatus TaxID=1810928 RepID=UPI003CCE0B89
MTSSMTIPKTMHALTQPDPKSTELLLTTVPTPTPTPNTPQHLVRVEACAPCSGELLWPANFPPATPRILIPCPDFAGTVVSAPPDSPFPPGTKVYTRANYIRNGAASEYTISITEELSNCPRGLSWAECAAIPLSAMTAWQALFVHAGIGGLECGRWKGKRVLVTGAAGGVGAWVVQLAKLAGASVIGTCGAHNLEFVRGLGADEVLDYRTMDIKAWASAGHCEAKVDVVIDCIGQKALSDAWWAVKDGGAVLSIFQPPGQVRPEGCEVNDVADTFFIMEPNGKHLEAITRLIEEGKCRGFVDSVWPLERFREAFGRVDTGHARGKVVIDFSLNRSRFD